MPAVNESRIQVLVVLNPKDGATLARDTKDDSIIWSNAENRAQRVNTVYFMDRDLADRVAAMVRGRVINGARPTDSARVRDYIATGENVVRKAVQS